MNKAQYVQFAQMIIDDLKANPIVPGGPGPQPASEESDELAHFYAEGITTEDDLVEVGPEFGESVPYEEFTTNLIEALDAVRSN